MAHLPFETDAPALLAAIALALRPLNPAGTSEASAAQVASPEAERTIWYRTPGGSAKTATVTGSPASAASEPYWLTPDSREPAPSVEAISRAIERDARRFSL